MAVNAELIRKVIKHIEQNNRWDQSVWGSLHKDQVDPYTDEALPEAWEGLTDTEERYGETYYLINLGIVMEGACNTRFCMAGHTVLQAGDKIAMGDEYGNADYCVDQDGQWHDIQHRARELLGLDLRQADTLFDGEAGNGDFEEYKDLVVRVTGVTFE